MLQKTGNKRLLISILSLSLLTVMAGAAVAPALGVIKSYFSYANPLLVQMIVSIPSVFIVITNFVFPKLCNRFGSKTLVLTGLVFYTLGGCLAGVFDNIYMVLAARALVGIGVGIIMPLSTGLLAYYYPPENQSKLMGYSSAMNQTGGVIATLLSGVLASISWRAAFLVYLLGFISIFLCMLFMPNDKIGTDKSLNKGEKSLNSFKKYYSYVLAMFLLMTTFFVYPVNFAIVTEATGQIPLKYVAVIMAMMDLIAALGGLLFVYIQKICKTATKTVSPLLFLSGYVLLAFLHNQAGIILGSICIGFANGIGIPFIISSASKMSGKNAITSVMPMISAALYLGQFLCPILISGISALISATAICFPYYAAIISAVAFLLVSMLIPKPNNR